LGNTLEAAWLFLCFGVIAGVVAFVDAVDRGNVLAALAFAAITLICCVGVYVPIGSKRVRSWWW
jgi:hypothetical protein